MCLSLKPSLHVPPTLDDPFNMFFFIFLFALNVSIEGINMLFKERYFTFEVLLFALCF